MRAIIRQLIEAIDEQIHISDGDRAYIRVEHFSVDVYQELIDHYRRCCDGRVKGILAHETLQNALSTKPAWARQVMAEGWADVEDRMTHFRNEAPDQTTTLLIGTETVADKGGLADFFCLSPREIGRRTGRSFHKWFNPSSGEWKGVDAFFETLFKVVPFIPEKFGEFVDQHGDVSHPSQILVAATNHMPEYWDLPRWTDGDGGLIRTAWTFRLREFKLPQDQEAALKAIDGLDVSPYESATELYDGLREYWEGNIDVALRERLFETNFSVINQIIRTKAHGIRSPQSIKVSGTPLEAIASAVTTICKDALVPLSVQIQEIRLACPPNEVDSVWRKIRRYGTGLLSFMDRIAEWPTGFRLICTDPDLFDATATPKSSTSLAKHKVTLLFEALNSRNRWRVVWEIPTWDWWLYALPDASNACLPVYITKQLSELTAALTAKDFMVQWDRTDIEATAFSMSDDVMDVRLQHIHSMRSAWIAMCSGLDAKGFYGAIETAGDFVQRYVDLIKTLNRVWTGEGLDRRLITETLKLFLLISPTAAQPGESVDHAVLLPWHPIVLEKLIEQARYQVLGLGEALTQTKTNSSPGKFWQRVQTLSEVGTACEGFFVNDGWEIPRQAAEGFFAIGSPDAMESGSYSAEYLGDDELDDDVDEDVTEADEDFGDLVNVHVQKFLEVFPNFRDNVTILFCRPRSLEVVKRAVQQLLRTRAESGVEPRYTVHVLDKRFGPSRQVFLENLLAEIPDGERSRLTIIYSRPGELASRVKVQLAFFEDSVPLSKPAVDSALVDLRNGRQFTRFPLVTLPMPYFTNDTVRQVVISQPQFEAGYELTQLLALMHGNGSRSPVDLVLSRKPDNETKKLLEDLHNQAVWVIVYGSTVDREFVRKGGGHIISFTTGIGDYGERNLTVSASGDREMDAAASAKRRLATNGAELFRMTNAEERGQLAVPLMRLAAMADGAVSLRALSPKDYSLHDLTSAALTVRNFGLDVDKPDVVRRLISLDSHFHWLKDAPAGRTANKRPDYLLVEVPERSVRAGGILDIYLTVIECKAGIIGQAEIDNALEQLKQGLTSLSQHWDPALWESPEGVATRYWRSQLYTVLCCTAITGPDTEERRRLFTTAFSKVLNGQYRIHWNANLQLHGQLASVAPTGTTIKINGTDVPVSSAFISSDEMARAIQGVDWPPSTFVPAGEAGETGDPKGYSLPLAPMPRAAEETEETYGSRELPSKISRNTASGSGREADASTTDMVSATAVASFDPADSTGSYLENVKLLIGFDANTNQPIYWYYGHPALPNRHITITGSSGSGKTYAIQGLMLEMVKAGLPTIVFDYTGGFSPSNLAPELKARLGDNLIQRIIKLDPFPINPFKPQMLDLGGQLAPELAMDVAGRLRDSFRATYGYGEQQAGLLYNLIREGITEVGDRMDLEYLVELLRKESSALANGVLNKIQQVVDARPFDPTGTLDWADIRDKACVFIIQLMGFPRELQVLMTELILWDAWAFSVGSGSVNSPFPVVLDEIQNLDPGEHGPVARIMAEGRKWGWSAWTATQFYTDSMTRSGGVERLQQSSTKLIFGPPDKLAGEAAQLIALEPKLVKEWRQSLSNLAKGQCVFLGHAPSPRGGLQKDHPRIVRVATMEEHIAHG